MPASVAFAISTLAALSLLGLAMATGMLRLSRRHGNGTLRLAMAAMGLLALVTFADTGLIAVRAAAISLGAGS